LNFFFRCQGEISDRSRWFVRRTSHQLFDIGFPDRRRFGARRRREERDDRLRVDVLEHAEQLRVAAAHDRQPQGNGEEKREIQKDHGWLFLTSEER
jgi:hypothetical protein